MRWSEFKAWLKRDRHASTNPPRKSRFRALKWTGSIFAGLVAILIIVLATLDWNVMRGPVGRYLSGRLHREVTITGDLKVKLFSWTPVADVNGLVIAQPDWVGEKIRTAGPFADVQHVTLAVDSGTIGQTWYRLCREARDRRIRLRQPDAGDRAPAGLARDR